MFPSGPWRGFYEYPGGGRDWMEPLTLAFDGRHVKGEGFDPVGEFTFQGTYLNGAVSLVKRYVGMHSVRYQGKVSGEGVITGTWNIGDWSRGSFALMPDRHATAGLPITEAGFGE
jgi:hypothetical protein